MFSLNTHTRRVFFALLLAALLTGLPPAAARPSPNAAAPKTVVRRVTYHGWKDALRLTNGRVEVVIVPSLGRVMAFQRAGQPGTNILWENPALTGRPFPYSAPYPANYVDWPNYGGDKLWPSPQDAWPQVQQQSGNWPPDPEMEAGPYQVTLYQNGLRLTGPVSQNWGLRSVRDFKLLPGADTLVLRETFCRVAPASGARQAPPVGLWNVAQIRPQATVYLPLNPRSRFPGGFYTFGAAPAAPGWDVAGGLLAITYQPGVGRKVGVDARNGWLAALYEGGLLFSERFALNLKGRYPDAGTSLQVWNNGDPAYLELEAQGALSPIPVGGRQTRLLTWTLRRLPQTPRTPAAARHLVQREMTRPE